MFKLTQPNRIKTGYQHLILNMREQQHRIVRNYKLHVIWKHRFYFDKNINLNTDIQHNIYIF